MFDLNREINRILTETDIADPVQIAAEILMVIPDESVERVLGILILPYIRNAISRHRQVPSSFPMQHHSSTRTVSPRVSASITYNWRSWLLSTRIPVGDGKWKLLGDCNVEDLSYAASERETLAAQNTAAALRYRTLASVLARSALPKVSDVSDTNLMNIFNISNQKEDKS